MPAVTVLPSREPGLGKFSSTTVGKKSTSYHESNQQSRAPLATRSSASQSYDRMNVAEIKMAARDTVQTNARHVSAKSLIKSACVQYREGNEHEGNRELKKSLGAYFQAIALAEMAIDARQGDLTVQMEINEFFKIFDEDRVKKVEERVKSSETVLSSFPASPSFADRMKSLKDNGLDVSLKRGSSRNLSEITSSSAPKPQPIATITSTLIPPLLPLKLPVPEPSNSLMVSPHTLVSPSQLGSPSPSSSPTVSPQVDTSDSYEYTNFPSIEELENSSDISLHFSTSTNDPSQTSSTSTGSNEEPQPVLPPILSQPYEYQNARPPSAPILQNSNSCSSLPDSPAMSLLHLKSPEFPASYSHNAKKSFIPVKGTATATELFNYMLENRKILFVDVRGRQEFERGHILSPAVVCIDPFNLLKENSTIQLLEESIMSKTEQTVFCNRDKFDIVIIYDDSSINLGGNDSPLSRLIHLIGGRSGSKILRRDPMLLIGGFKAWNDHVQYTKLLAPMASSYPASAMNEGVLQTTAFGRRSAAEVLYPTKSPKLSSSNYDFSSKALPSPICHAKSVDNIGSPTTLQATLSGASITYPQVSRRIPPLASGSSAIPSSSIPTPPLASVNPSHLSNKRSEIYELSQEAFVKFNVDYPRLSLPSVPRPPPPAASSARERQDMRYSVFPTPEAKPMKFTVTRTSLDWSQECLTPRGLVNLGNTCWMNSTIQCLNATVPFVNYFLDDRWKSTVDASKGRMASAYAQLVSYMKNAGDHRYIVPNHFHDTICSLMPHFEKGKQHDSQEFLGGLLDMIDEELKSPLKSQEFITQNAKSTPVYSAWIGAGIVTSCFQSECSSRLQCSICETTSVTHEQFNFLQLSLPGLRVDNNFPPILSIYHCLDEYFREEIMEKDNQWLCPKCGKSRKASKKVSLTRPPSVLVLHLKRYTLIQDGSGERMIRNNIFVDFPLDDLDLTRYVNFSAVDNHGQPLQQSPPTPCKYNLYGVTNHCGSESLDRGHYTALISCDSGWLKISDTKVSSSIRSNEIVSSEAYVLFYRRTKL